MIPYSKYPLGRPIKEQRLAAADDVWYATNCCMAFQTNVRSCLPLCLSRITLSFFPTWWVGNNVVLMFTHVHDTTTMNTIPEQAPFRSRFQDTPDLTQPEYVVQN